MVNYSNLEVIEDQCFSNILSLIYQLTGITVAKNRKSMVLGRLRKRVIALKLPTYEEYYDFAKSNDEEKVIFTNLVTTNETYFYRTPRVWNYISDKYLTAWFQKNKGKTLQVWSAAASSGEEASTLAILMQAFKEKNPGFQYQIFGTDISQEMIELCNSGIYSGRSIESFKTARPELFVKYLKEVSSGSYSLITEIKSRLKFERHNLFQPLKSIGKFDLVLLRNVLIYFTPTDQEKVLFLLRNKITDDGILIIGESESLAHVKSEFTMQEPFIYSKANNKKIDIKSAS